MTSISVELTDKMGDDLKLCKTCNQTKKLDQFDNRPERGANSKRTVCTSCRAEGQRRRYKKHCLENPFKIKVTKAKQRSIKLGLPFNLDQEYLESIWTGVCPALGIEIFNGQDRVLDNTAELDRLIPSLGYTRGNVIFLSRRANRIKNDASLDELQKITKWMEKAFV